MYTNVNDYASSYKYSTYLAGSDNYCVITNNEIEGDSACIIVKEASGNSFAPYVAEHYKKTYVVDYRKYSGNLSKLAEETGAIDIIYYIPIEDTTNSTAIKNLTRISK